MERTFHDINDTNISSKYIYYIRILVNILNVDDYPPNTMPKRTGGGKINSKFWQSVSFGGQKIELWQQKLFYIRRNQYI